MSILALDIATKCGWAVLRDDGAIVSGMQAFQTKANEQPGARFNRFYCWLLELQRAHAFDRIAYEEVSFIGGPQATYAVQLYGGFLAIMLMHAHSHQLRVQGYAVPTVKKQFAGSGKATKDDMIAQCRAMGFKPQDDNEADAIAVLHVATDRCPVLTMSGATPKNAPKRVPTVPAIQPDVDPF